MGAEDTVATQFFIVACSGVNRLENRLIWATLRL